MVRFYVGNITGTTPQTVTITRKDKTTYVDYIQVSEGNKWYTYVLPKDKGLYRIHGNSVKKVVVKADISYKGGNHMYPPECIIPKTTIEASFKGSNTSNITSMYGMFDACSNLTSLDVSSFDTSNVTDMKNMFDYCSGLASLDVSSFDTSNQDNLSLMFENCAKLESLDLSSFNTSKVNDMTEMFNGCAALTSLDLSGWYMSIETIFTNDMFKGCGALKEIKMIGCKQPTVNKIKAQLTTDGITGATITTK